MASSQKQHYNRGLKSSFHKNIVCNLPHVSYRSRKTEPDSLKISVNPYMDRATVSKRIFSAVRQKMQGLNYKSLEIKARIKRGALHSILFDNSSNNKDKNQILGVILDARSHFASRKSRNSRYITFSSGLNELRSFSQNEAYETCISEGSCSRFSGFRFKKINISFAVLLVFALCFFVSCGGGSSKPANESGGDSVSNFGKLGQECYPNKSCDEGLLCDEEKNICVEDPENQVNDSDKPSENNDSDKPTENNDSDKPVEDNDEDKPIENNDNDGNLAEQTDNDTPLTDCAPEAIIVNAEEITDYSQEEIQEGINYHHDRNRSQCYGSFIEKKEKLDTKGNLCIEDECILGPNDIAQGDNLWIDDIPFMVGTISSYGLPPPQDIQYYKKVHHQNKAGPTDITIKRNTMTLYVKNVPTVSCFAPNNIIDNASTNTIIIDDGCYSGGQSISNIVTKNILPKMSDTDFKKACNKMPNSTYDYYDKQCYTTITEFAWLENVISYLHNESYTQWYNAPLTTTKIEKDWNNNTFYVYLSADSQHKWVVELPNAKRCLDECYGIEGCEVSIKPNSDLSNGCIVKEPENASLMRPNTKNKTPLMAKQKNYARVDMKKLPKRNLAVSPW